MPAEAPIAKLDEIPNHGQLSVVVEDTIVLLIRHDSEVYALEDRCTHDESELSGGNVDGFVVTCPRHGAQFDIRTGMNLRMPATRPTCAYKTRVEDDKVYLILEE